MSNITFHDFLEHQVPNVYEKVPHSGFQSNDEKGQPITVEQYFDIIFQEIEEKLTTSVPAGDKFDLDLSKLIQYGDTVKPASKNFGDQTPPWMIDYLITNIKSTKKSAYGAGYKPAVKKVTAATQTGKDILEALLKDKSLHDFINQQ